jgi:hypothetical protein
MVEGALHVSHIQGIVVNGHGKPVVGAKVTLARAEKVAYETKTDDSGRFDFDHVSGQYLLHVNRTEYAGASREVIVGGSPDDRDAQKHNLCDRRAWCLHRRLFLGLRKQE